MLPNRVCIEASDKSALRKLVMVSFPSKRNYFILKASAIWQISTVSVCVQAANEREHTHTHADLHPYYIVTQMFVSHCNLMEFLTRTPKFLISQFAQFSGSNHLFKTEEWRKTRTNRSKYCCIKKKYQFKMMKQNCRSHVFVHSIRESI